MYLCQCNAPIKLRNQPKYGSKGFIYFPLPHESRSAHTWHAKQDSCVCMFMCEPSSLRKRPHMIYLHSVMPPLVMHVKFILISLLPALSLLALLFSLFSSSWQSTAAAAAAFPSPLCHLHSLPPPTLSPLHLLLLPSSPSLFSLFFCCVFADETGSLPVFHISWQQSG